MKTDAELETLLRSTFDGRAATVTTAAPFTAPPAHGRTRTWVAAAAAAAVVAALAVTIAVVPRGHSNNTRHHVTSPTPTPAPRHNHAPREISLNWFGVKPLPGYVTH